MAAPSRSACPAEDALFRLLTGDVSRRRRARLQRHVDACPACAARLRGWEEATAVYREYVAQALPIDRGEGAATAAAAAISATAAASARAGSAAAARLSTENADRVATVLFAERLRREPRPSHAWPGMRAGLFGWRSIAAGLLLAVAGLLGFLPAEQTLNADALVARAVANDGAPSRTPAHGVTITAAPAASSTTRVLMSEQGAEARELAERLAEYAFDWRAPLSARPYQQWRAALASRTDRCDWIDADRIRISTHATHGRIERAELILRAPDYRPVGQTWQFADGFEVELRIPEPGTPAPVTPAASRTLNAVSAPPAVAPGVAVARGARAAKGARISFGADVAAGLQAWLDRTYGAGPARAGYLRTARKLDAEFQNAVSTLDTLAQRYSAEIAATESHGRGPAAPINGVPATASHDLRRLIAAQYSRVTSSYERLEAHLAPLTGSVSRRVLPAAPPPDWPVIIDRIAPATRDLSALLAALPSSAVSRSSGDAIGNVAGVASTQPNADANANAAADAFERSIGTRLRDALVAVVPR